MITPAISRLITVTHNLCNQPLSKKSTKSKWIILDHYIVLLTTKSRS